MLSSLLVHPFEAAELPPAQARTEGIAHAPRRQVAFLTVEERVQCVKNALRYLPERWHATMALEFFEELDNFGHIYAYRFRPTDYEILAHPLDKYPAKSRQAALVQHMIMNNLSHAVAQFPEELVTYGGNGSVFSNWCQYRLTMYYLSIMSDGKEEEEVVAAQTLVLYSGHPHGLFVSHKDAPRVVVTNGMVVWNYSTTRDYDRMYAMGVSQFGQMTAGSFCYIGPQGIVHGTTLTLLGASRRHLDSSDLSGRVFVTAGLGGMSGAQAKAAVVCGAIGVVAEVDAAALNKRHAQGWVQLKTESLDECVEWIREHRKSKKSVSIGYLGNVVSLWERLAEEKDLPVELGSDQTSCHNPYNGGYYPVQLSLEESNEMMIDDPERFKELVQESLRRHIGAIEKLSARGMYFWDYGNSFLLECGRASANVWKDPADEALGFKYPSYVQDIMGDIFSLGFGPYRWVCTSADPQDLRVTDEIARSVMEKQLATANPLSAAQIKDNLHWIIHAEENKLVVGSQARILYADAAGRSAIAVEMNNAVKDGRISAPVAISRDHHDVSSCDSPWRETSNIYDGSVFTADMAVQNFVGDAFRGATVAALHNGGGTGWGEAVNGGFILCLDGSDDAERRARQMLLWDVTNGVTRRAWAGNSNANLALDEAMAANPGLRLTKASPMSQELESMIRKKSAKK